MKKKLISILLIFLLIIVALLLIAYVTNSEFKGSFPRSQVSYYDGHMTSVPQILVHRIKAEPFNLVALLIFICAIVHTLMTSYFHRMAHDAEHECEELKAKGKIDKAYQSVEAGVFHLLGEVEVVFGIWAIVLAAAVAIFYDWKVFVTYISGIHYREPLFIIVIMTIASSRPIIKFFEFLTWRVVKLLGNTIEAWWLTILILAPILGSFITEPAAMTICAYLLSEKIYQLGPSRKLRYATLALLFVNISIGGALTNFAAPPILVVAEPWEWDALYMLLHFGWKSVVAIVISTLAYFFLLRDDIQALREPYQHYQYKRYIQRRFIHNTELEESFQQLSTIVDNKLGFSAELEAYSDILKGNMKDLAKKRLTPEELDKFDVEDAIEEKYEDIHQEMLKKILPGLLPEDRRPEYRDPHWNTRPGRVPAWIVLVHLGFLIWTVVNNHNTVLFLSGFLFFLGFFQVSIYYQNRIDLKPSLLVAFFLAGLMIHGNLQSWWIGPLLGNLPELGLNATSILLTAFNDNASITYLSTLVPGLSESLKYAIVSGAITGGGLTIIANAPNPVGQSILKKHFGRGISAGMLFRYALLPTLVAALVFFLFR